MGTNRLGIGITVIALLIILTLPFRFTSLLATDADRDQALELATNLHQRMSSGDIDGICNDSDGGMKAGSTLAHHRAFFSAVARKLGAPLNCQLGATEVEYGLTTKRLRTWCTTRFSKDSTGVETLVWVRSNGQYRLFYYWLNSDDLVTR